MQLLYHITEGAVLIWGNQNQEVCIKEQVEVLIFQNFPYTLQIVQRNWIHKNINENRSVTKLISNKQKQISCILRLKALKILPDYTK